MMCVNINTEVFFFFFYTWQILIPGLYQCILSSCPSTENRCVESIPRVYIIIRRNRFLESTSLITNNRNWTRVDSNISGIERTRRRRKRREREKNSLQGLVTTLNVLLLIIKKKVKKKIND